MNALKERTKNVSGFLTSSDLKKAFHFRESLWSFFF